MESKNFKDFRELMQMVATSILSIKQANSDGEVNWKDFPVLYPIVTSVMTGIDGIQNTVPIFQSVDPEVIAQREQILMEAFNGSVNDPVLSLAISNLMLNIIGGYANSRIIINRISAN